MKKEQLTLRQKVEYPLVIPESIDIDQLLAMYPPKTKAVNHDSLLYIINTIHRRMHINSRNYENKEDGHIPLKAAYMMRVIPNWKNCKDYLVELKVIDCDGIYQTGISSFGFRINLNYFNGQVKKAYFKSSKLYFKLARLYEDDNQFQELWRKKRDYLFTPFFNHSISIDEQGAKKWLRQYYFDQRFNIHGDNKIPHDEKLEKIKSLKTSCFMQREKIMQIINCDFSDYLFTDKTGYRFHTVLTNMKRELRNFIKIDGEDACQIDLKNSQPFLFLNFFKDAFWQTKKSDKIRLIDIDREYYEYLIKILHNNSPYTILKYSKTLVNTDFSNLKFINLVLEGKLYDYFLNKYQGIFKEDNTVIWDAERTKTKKAVLAFLYDANRKSKSYGLRLYFQKEFPSIYQFIGVLKTFESGKIRSVRKPVKMPKSRQIDPSERDKYYEEVDEGFTKLVTTLQRIESTIFLDRICKKISELYPELNYLTVHDSIIVPVSATNMVYDLMHSEILDATGEIPRFDVKDLVPENLVHELVV